MTTSSHFLHENRLTIDRDLYEYVIRVFCIEEVRSTIDNEAISIAF